MCGTKVSQSVSQLSNRRHTSIMLPRLIYTLQFCGTRTSFTETCTPVKKCDDIRYKQGTPFRPFEQLMGVLPPASKHALPRSMQDLMDESSVIGEFYPSTFELDLNGKNRLWQAVRVHTHSVPLSVPLYVPLSFESDANGKKQAVEAVRMRDMFTLTIRVYKSKRALDQAHTPTLTSSGCAAPFYRREEATRARQASGRRA